MLKGRVNNMEIKNFNDFIKNFKNISSPILIFGQETNLINNTINEVYKLVNDFSQINITIMDGENLDVDVIVNACETTPFFSDKKIVHIKNAEHIFNNSALTNSLAKYINNVPKTTILMLSCYVDIDKNNILLKQIKNNGLLVEYKKLKGLDLQSYIFELIKSKNKKISKSNLVYLTSEVAGSSENIDLEIEKLIDYIGDKEYIEKEDIDNIVYKSIESNVFKMNDYIMKKDVDNSILIYKNMIFQGEEELKILAMIYRNFKIIYLLKICLENNIGYEDVVKKFNLKDFSLKNYLKMCKLMELSDLEYALKKCYLCDISIKQGEQLPSIAVENLIVELCA